MQKGYWIAIDGVDAVGKSTQVNAVAQMLREEGFQKVIAITEFSNSPVGKTILDILHKKRFYSLNDSKNSPLADTITLVADMLYHWETIIRPTVLNGGIVISDRGPSSLVSYQSIRLAERNTDFQRETAFNWISQLTNHCGLKPDVTLILNISEDEMKSRVMKRESTPLVKTEVKFLNNVNDLVSQTDELSYKFMSISGEGSIQTVSRRIVNSLRPILGF